MKEALLKISPDGSSIDIDAGEGFVGTACQEFSKAMAGVLGTVEDERLKDEYYQSQGQSVKTR